MTYKSLLSGLLTGLAALCATSAEAQTWPPSGLPDSGGRLGVWFSGSASAADQPACLRIAGIMKRSPLADVLRTGDCIFAVNRFNVRNVSDLAAVVASGSPGSELTLTSIAQSEQGSPPRTTVVHSVAETTLALQYADLANFRLEGTQAELQFRSRAPDRDPGDLIDPLKEIYADRAAPENERYAAGMRVLDILALGSETSGEPAGHLSAIGGAALETPVYIANHKSFFDYTFGPLSGNASHRREWQEHEVVVAASYPACQISNVFLDRGADGPAFALLKDYIAGWMDPSHPNAFFKLAMSASEKPNGLYRDATEAENACEETRASIGIAMPVFVLSGHIHCYDNCESRYEFAVDRVTYAYRGVGLLEMTVNTVALVDKMRDLAAQLGGG